MAWPHWWTWELDCDHPHLQKRVAERAFDEIDLRDMLERATAWTTDPLMPGRYRIDTTRGGGRWRVIVEPSDSQEMLHVITAFERES